ncbi:MAG: hypothetical protein ABII90_10360 [Bacteroidota bacterium]
MQHKTTNYQLLINKLDEFIRKYYKNQLIKGGIYSIGIVLLFYIAVTALEYFAHYGMAVRTILFYSFLLINSFILTKLVIIPLVHLYKLGTIITYEQAAIIIGKHFTEVKDRLLNILQLKQQSDLPLTPPALKLRRASTHHPLPIASGQAFTLLEASIDQKINELKPIPFTSAINLSKNRRYIKYAITPILLIVIIIFTSPTIITDSTKRLVKHRTYFEKTAPFKFIIENNELKAIQQEDFELKVKITGDEIPDDVFLEFNPGWINESGGTGGNQQKLRKRNTVSRYYLFKNVQKTIFFRLFADGFYSKEYKLTALPNPIVLNFETILKYPGYLNKKDDIFKNTGDIIIPAGTKTTWNFSTKDTHTLRMSFFSGGSTSSSTLYRLGENKYSHTEQFFKNTSYSVKTSNEYIKNRDSIVYSINVIPDLYPGIDVEEHKDSLSAKHYFFTGTIKDDYGFEKLNFNYRFLKKEGSIESNSKIFSANIKINKNFTQNQFFYYWDILKFNVQAGDEIEYFFEVWDNDGVNGSKSTTSQKKIFKALTLKEIAESTSKENEEIKRELEENIMKARELQKEMKELDKKLLNKKSLSWEEKKRIQDMLNIQKELQKSIEQIQREASKNFERQSEFRELSENILKKQQQLEDLFEKIMTDEMKKLFVELENLIDEVDKSKMQQMLEKMNLSNKDIEKELDRTLEIFKQLEFEQKLEEVINKLDVLAKEEEKLSEESLEKKADSERLMQKQEKLNNDFKDIRDDLNDLEKKNKDLEYPNNLENTEDDEKSINEDMQESSDYLDKGKNKNASGEQKDASDKMKQLSDKPKQMQADMQMQGAEEDIHALRELLENLVQLSFDQEDLMTELNKTSQESPQYVRITKDQKKLKDDAKMIEDSLFALSKRVIELESIVNREISAINMNMEKAIELMADSRNQNTKSKATSRQQYIMTSVNNLALLLSEVVEQIQNQMASEKQGSGDCQKAGCKKPGCKKPGHGKQSISSMKQLQESLNNRIQNLKDGKNPGGKEGMSKELARLAAQQESIRNELQKINQQLNKDGQGSLGNLEKLAKMMEETETDLVNRRITQETIMRQQKILTRLLEAEKAARERDTEQRRKSIEAKNEDFSNYFDFFEYKRLKQKEMELLKTVPPSLKPFYKNKVNEYFNFLNE